MIGNTGSRGQTWNRREFLSRTALGAGAVGLGGFAGKARADTVTINVLTLGEGIFGDPFLKLSPEFTAATGVKVNNVAMGYNETMQKEATVFAAASSELDVVAVDYMFLKGFAKAGHLAALDDLIPAAEMADFVSDTPQGLRDVWAFDGKTYGMSTIGNCQNSIYNKKLLGDAGLGTPDTWADVLSSAQKVVDASQNRYGFVAGTERLTKAVLVWLPIAWSNGAELFDDKWRPIFNSKPGVDSLSFLLELMKTMPPGGGAYTESDEVKSLATGLAALDPVSWIPDSIKTATPEVKPQLVTRIAPMGAVRRAPVLGGIGLTVSNYSPNKVAAAKFVAWFNSRDVQISKIVQNGGQPCRNSAWAANLNAEPWFASLSENLKVAKPLPQIPEWGQIDAAISAQLSSAFAGEIDAKTALDRAAASVDGVMKDAGYH
jgi:multiple sugar transport system substrate-binding protein